MSVLDQAKAYCTVAKEHLAEFNPTLEAHLGLHGRKLGVSADIKTFEAISTTLIPLFRDIDRERSDHLTPVFCGRLR